MNDQLKGQVGIKCGYSMVRGLTGVVPRVSIFCTINGQSSGGSGDSLLSNRHRASDGVTEDDPWVHIRAERSITVVVGDERRRNTRGCALKCHWIR